MIEEKKKNIPCGVLNFKKLIEKKYLMVDKSLFIKDFIEDPSSDVILITRPRRFGKTLNISMLNYFLNEKYKDDSEELFKDLKICEDKKIMKLRGSSPVIMLNLKDISGDNYIELLQSMAEKMFELYESFEYLGKSHSTQEEYNYIKKSLQQASRKISTKLPGKTAEIDVGLLTVLKSSLKNLTKLIHKHEGKKSSYVLIDEYDAFAQNTENTNSQSFKGCIKFFKMFLGAALKGNEYLEKCLMMGIMPLALAEVSSGINNAAIYTVLDKGYVGCFGFSEKEVKKAWEKHHGKELLEEELLAIRNWYDGYNFSDVSGIYNPISIMQYIRTKEIKSYWNQTAYSDRLEKIVKNNPSLKEVLRTLVSFDENNNRLTVKHQHNTGLVFKALENCKEGFLALLLHYGLLTKHHNIGANNYALVIPNNEVCERIGYLNKLFLKDKSINGMNKLVSSVEEKRPDQFCESFYQCLQDVSFRTLNVGTREISYELYMLGLLYYTLSSVNYIAFNQKNTPAGITDLVLEPLHGDKSAPVWIIEFKAPKSTKEIHLKDLEYIYKLISCSEEELGEINNKKLSKSECNKLKSTDSKLQTLLKSSSEKALDQINIKGYAKDYSRSRVANIIQMGLSFYGKNVGCMWEMKNLNEQGNYNVTSQGSKYFSLMDDILDNNAKYHKKSGIISALSNWFKKIKNDSEMISRI